MRRDIGLLSATLVVAGGTIGGGIFFAPSEVARALPSDGAILLVWAIGGVIALAGALTYAELGANMPASGGHYVYIREAFGELPAFLFGWMSLTAIASGAIGAVSLAFAGYVGRIVDLGAVGGERGLAVATIAAASLVNYLGLKPGVVLQNVLATAKIAAIAGLLVGSIVFWQKLASATPAPATAHGTLSLSGAAAGFVPVLFTIGGFQQINMLAEEVRDPRRVLPRALLFGVSIVVACYLGANVAYLHAMGRDGLAASHAIASDTSARLYGPHGGTMIAIGVMLSMLGLAHVILFSTPRVLFAMARDRLFFSVTSAVHPRFGSPHVAIWIIGAWSIVLLLAVGGRLGALLGSVVFADWIFVGMGAASLFVLRRRRPGAGTEYRTPGYPIVPALFVAAAAVGVVSAVVASPRASLLGLLLLVVGAGVFAARRR